MANVYDFSSDRINVFMMLLDDSGSMENDAENMREGLAKYKKEFAKCAEANSVAISRSTFNDEPHLKDFRPLSELDTTTYRPGGATAIYYSIIEAAKHLKRYMQEVTKRTNIVPRATFMVFSDGEPCRDCASPYEAKEAISDLNYMGVTTVFVAFGGAVSSNFGKRLGFLATKDVTNRNDLGEFMEEFSKSCKEQSQSLKALGANFFSSAVNSSSTGYSATTQQALEDKSWYDEI